MYYCRECDNSEEFNRNGHRKVSDVQTQWATVEFDGDGNIGDYEETDSEDEDYDAEAWEFDGPMLCGMCNRPAIVISQQEYDRIQNEADYAMAPTIVPILSADRKKILLETKKELMKKLTPKVVAKKQKKGGQK